MIYVDDSGAERGGLIIYGWVEVRPADWRIGLRSWLELRKMLFTLYGIHVSQELHATDYVNGRGKVSSNPPDRLRDAVGTILWKDLGREVAEHCLATLRDCNEIKVGSVFRRTSRRGAQYATDKYELYRDFLNELDRELAVTDSFGFVTMDGDDPHYRAAHRSLKLDTRRVIEDPAFHDSRHSQWTQMADLVAYVANIHLNRHEGNEFGWSWYEKYLAGSDVNHGPQETARPA
jgi:hypothetical protein